MKIIVLFFITFYQIFLSALLKSLLGSFAFCRYRPTCSQYAKQVIQTHGVMKGGYLSLLRILSCSPLHRYGTV